MLSQLDYRILALESIKDQYVLDPDFKDVFLKEGRTWNKFVINDGFMFRANRLCIPVGSVLSVVVAGSAWRRTDGPFW